MPVRRGAASGSVAADRIAAVLHDPDGEYAGFCADRAVETLHNGGLEALVMRAEEEQANA